MKYESANLPSFYPSDSLSVLCQQIEVEVCGSQSSDNMQLFLGSFLFHPAFATALSLIALGNCLFCSVAFFYWGFALALAFNRLTLYTCWPFLQRRVFLRFYFDHVRSTV